MSNYEWSVDYSKIVDKIKNGEKPILSETQVLKCIESEVKWDVWLTTSIILWTFQGVMKSCNIHRRTID